MKRQYEAIVIDTGFGGAVSACRVVRAGIGAGLLGRGRRHSMNGFPRDPKKSARLPSCAAIDLTFTETMRGFISKGFSPTDTYETATEAGRRANSTVEFTLAITAPDLDALLVDRNHTAIAQGRVRVDGFTPPEGAPVTNGVFNLFIPGQDENERRMLYALPFHGADGKPYLLDGFEDVRRHDGLDVWPGTTALYTVIREGHDHHGAILAAGIMRIPHGFTDGSR